MNNSANTKRKKPSFFERFASWVSKAAGSTPAFLGAFAIIVIWAITGPMFDFSETWQLVINTGTTIITFLMVFLIQKSQNKDSMAIQMKLNELVAASEAASNRLVDVEDMSEDELKVIRKYYRKLAELSQSSQTLRESHSIDEAEDRHNQKSGRKVPVKK